MEENKKKSNTDLWIIIGIIIISVMVVIVGALYIVLSDIEINPEYVNEYNEDALYDNYDDEEFIAWISDTSNTLHFYLRGIAKSADNFDLNLLSYYGEKLEEKSDIYLLEIHSFDISPDLSAVKAEYYAALQDTKKAGYYTRLGADNVDADYLRYAADYMDKAREHITAATYYLKEY